MFIWTYRYIRRKLREREARRAATEPGENEEQAGARVAPAAATPTGSPQVASEAKSPWWRPSADTKFNLLLMAALAIPVFLETLDYTGAWSSPPPASPRRR